MSLLALAWDIRDPDSRPYLDFIRYRYLPMLSYLGMTRREVLFRLAGEAPEIFSILEASSEQALQSVLHSDEWRRLIDELGRYVTNYRQYELIAPPRARL